MLIINIRYFKLGLFIFDNVEDLRDAAIEIRKRGIVPNLLEFMDKTILLN